MLGHELYLALAVLGWGGKMVEPMLAFMVGFYLLVLCYMSYVALQMGTLLLCFDVYV